MADVAPARDRPLPPGVTFLLTDDQRGVAAELAGRLRGEGVRALLLRAGERAAAEGDDVFRADLADTASVAEAVALARRACGQVHGLVHVAPLQPAAPMAEMDLARWRGEIARGAGSLFRLARALAPDLKKAGAEQRGWLLAATGMGGLSGAGAPFFAGHGAVAGLVRSLRYEWPGASCRTVELDPTEPAADLADYLLREIRADDDELDVAYRRSRRKAPRPADAPLPPLPPEPPAEPPVGPDSVVLVTGGARGITADVAREIARRWRPTLVIAGRSPLPAGEEPGDTAGLASEREIKAALIERSRAAGGKVSPAAVEAAYQRLVQDREISASLAEMEKAGSTVGYIQADVRRAEQVEALIKVVYETYGRLDGVIHGAGVIEDKLIEDKTDESFERVFETKVAAAFCLSRALRPEGLRFLAFFSSVAGLFGNRGQTDYAAANETLNRMALDLNTRWPARVLSVDWGPWDKTGMATEGVRQQFADRGVQLIPPDAGSRAFADEIAFGRKEDAVVVLGDGPWRRPARQGGAGAGRLPMLDRTNFVRKVMTRIESTIVLDPAQDRYLADHVIDGKPVLPMAMALELMAEVINSNWPDQRLLAIKRMQVLRGIVLDSATEPRELRVVAERDGTNVTLRITGTHKPDWLHYRAVATLGPALPEPPPFPPPVWDDVEPFPMSVAEAYSTWLFHGPLFQHIATLDGIGRGGIVGTLAPSSPKRSLAGSGGESWVLDPVAIDSALQLILLWIRTHYDMTGLPAGFEEIALYAPFGWDRMRCWIVASPECNDGYFIGDAYFTRPDGSLVAAMKGIESYFSRELNRIVGSGSAALLEENK